MASFLSIRLKKKSTSREVLFVFIFLHEHKIKWINIHSHSFFTFAMKRDRRVFSINWQRLLIKDIMIVTITANYKYNERYNARSASQSNFGAHRHEKREKHAYILFKRKDFSTPSIWASILPKVEQSAYFRPFDSHKSTQTVILSPFKPFFVWTSIQDPVFFITLFHLWPQMCQNAENKENFSWIYFKNPYI